MKVVKKVIFRRAKKSMNPYLRGATPEQRKWLKNHTLSDLEEIAEMLGYQGEDVTGITQVIDELNTVAASLGVVTKSYAKHDLLEFVRADEAKITA